MLFDLRSRGRRRTVQVIYLGLALLMGGGLVLFGVGAGNGFGGILNAFNGNGNGSAQKQQISQQQKQAIAQTKADPTSAAAWEALAQADYVAAGQGTGFNTSTSEYTTAGKATLASAMQAYQKYLTLTKKPDPTMAVLAARAYDALGQYKNEVEAWQIVTAANPTAATYYEDLAIAAYEAKNATLGDLSAAKAVSLVPKAQRFELKQQLKQDREQILGTSASTSTTTSASTTAKSTTTSTKSKKR